MTTFVTGCTHFGHAKIIRLANRPFTSVDEMDATLVENWNAVVKPTDTVFHLGDFAFRSSNDPADYAKKLHGKITFLQGNHDPADWGPPYLSFKYRKRKVVLMHYPIEEWDGWWRGAIHLHCHTHKPELVSAERRFNVGVDATGFAPVNLDTLFDQVAE